MVKYTEEMHLAAKKMRVDAKDLFPQFSGRMRKYIVNTVIDLELKNRDMSRILLFNEEGDMEQILMKTISVASLSDQYNRALNRIAKIIIAKNKEILAREKDPEGFYILWADDNFFEIRYFLKEEIALHGRIYHIQGKGSLKMATNNINEAGRIANITTALLILVIISMFFMLVARKIGAV